MDLLRKTSITLAIDSVINLSIVKQNIHFIQLCEIIDHIFKFVNFS